MPRIGAFASSFVVPKSFVPRSLSRSRISSFIASAIPLPRAERSSPVKTVYATPSGSTIVMDVPTTRPSRIATTEQSRTNVSFSKYTSRTASNGGGGGIGSGRGMSIWVVERHSWVARWNATRSGASASSRS